MSIPIIGDIIKAVRDLASEAIVDKDKRAEMQLRLTDIADRASQREQELMMGQIGVNKTEAEHASIFVAGWRPAVGWVSVAGMAYAFVLEPLINWIARVVFGYAGVFPEVQIESLIILLTGMLGFGTIRAVETVKGVARDRINPADETYSPIPPGFG